MGLMGQNELIYKYQCVLVAIGNGNHRADICCEPEISIFLRNGCCDITYIELALREIIGTMVANGQDVPKRADWENTSNTLFDVVIDLKESFAYRKPVNGAEENFLKAVIKSKVPDEKEAEELLQSVFNYAEQYMYSRMN
jgi:hypothetical protein